MGASGGLDFGQVQELIDDLNIGRNRGVSEPRLQQAFENADADNDGCGPTCTLSAHVLMCICPRTLQSQLLIHCAYWQQAGVIGGRDCMCLHSAG